MSPPKSAPSKPAAKPRARRAAKPSAAPEPERPTIFLPTLLPDPFGEASPELCWEWSHGPARVSVRLTQFGWQASAFVEGSAISHWRADTLQDLREEAMASLSDGSLPPSFDAPLGSRWALAYEVAGF